MTTPDSEEFVRAGALFREKLAEMYPHLADAQERLAELEAYEVLAETAAVPARRTFIGRTVELQKLRDQFHLAADRRPSIMLIDGLAGVGKTRLISEFVHEVQGRAIVLSGGCVELGPSDVPYGPLIEALRQLKRQREPLPEPAITLSADLERMLGDFDGDKHGEGSPGAQARVFALVLSLLEELGAHRPAVLILEDLQWADPSTVDLIAFLARRKSIERLQLIGTYRSGALAQLGKHPLRMRLAERGFTERIERVTLAGLPRTEFRQLMRSLSSDVDRDRWVQYFEVSDGNPLHGELLMKHHDPATGEPPRVPRELADIIKEQVSQLGADALTIVRIAAVAGRRAGNQLLMTVSGFDAERLAQAVQECVDQEVLVEHCADGTYGFKHDLLRKTVYELMILLKRQHLHKAIADQLGGDPRRMLELAHHRVEAGQDPEALAATVSAGRMAMRMRAFQEAEIRFRQALRLWKRVGDPGAVTGTTRVEILAAAADAARWAGHVEQAVAHVREAIAEAGVDTDPVLRGELQERLGSYLWEAGSFSDSVAALKEAELLLPVDPPSAVASRVIATLATATVREGHYRDAVGTARYALQLARAAGARAEEGRALASLGLALALCNEADEGVPLLRDALQIADESGHLEDLLRTYGNLGVALEHSGDFDAAVDIQREGLAEARQLGLFGSRQGGVLANNVSAAQYLLGRWDEAVELLDEAIEDRPVRESVYLRLTRAQIAVARGQWATALRLLQEVSGHPYSDPRFVAPLYISFAEMEIWRGDPAAAHDMIRRGLDEVSKADNDEMVLQLCVTGLRAAADAILTPLIARDERDMAQLRRLDLWNLAQDTIRDKTASREFMVLSRQCAAEFARADDADSDQLWREVADDWQSLRQPYPEAYALWRLAERVVRSGKRAPASGPVRQALAIASELGAEPLRGNLIELAHLVRVDPEALPQEQAAKVAELSPADRVGLTEKERHVLKALQEGRTNRQIGTQLGMKESTASVHVSNILRKLRVRSRTEAAMAARKLGLGA